MNYLQSKSSSTLQSCTSIDIHTGEVYTNSMVTKEVKLTYKVPVVAYDRVTVMGYKEGTFDILFLKTTSTGVIEEVDVVAGVRCYGTEQLKQFIQTINETLKKEQQRET